MNLNRDKINHFRAETDSGKGAHEARWPLPSFKVKLEQKRGIMAQESSFPIFGHGRERGRERESTQASFDDPQSFVGRISSSQEQKFTA